MDYKDSFICPVCLELAKEAVVSSCCTKVFCSLCLTNTVTKYGHCPCCRSQKIVASESNITRKLIAEIKVPCQYCEKLVENGEMSNHLGKCPNVKINCRVCNNVFPQGELPNHTVTKHEDEIRKYIIQSIDAQTKVNPPKVEISRSTKNRYFGSLINKFGRKANLGMTSKYFCAGKLEGKCSCCDGGCGPDNGQNCDACMELDIKRWNLPQGFLINTEGYVCQVLRIQGMPKVTCFRILGTKKEGLFSKTQSVITCRAGSPCNSCAQVENSIRIGRYVGLY